MMRELPRVMRQMVFWNGQILLQTACQYWDADILAGIFPLHHTISLRAVISTTSPAAKGEEILHSVGGPKLCASLPRLRRISHFRVLRPWSSVQPLLSLSKHELR